MVEVLTRVGAKRRKGGKKNKKKWEGRERPCLFIIFRMSGQLGLTLSASTGQMICLCIIVCISRPVPLSHCGCCKGNEENEEKNLFFFFG